MGRGKQWLDVENVLVCKAYISTSEDPVKGNEQKMADFQQSIHQKFVVMFQKLVEEGEIAKFSVDGRGPQRTSEAVFGQWKKIRPALSKFAGYYSQAEKNAPSGTNRKDVYSNALALFKEAEKEEFGYEECWLFAESCQKFMIVLAPKDENGKLAPKRTLDEEARPIGRKAAKASFGTPSPSPDLAAIATERNDMFRHYMTSRVSRSETQDSLSWMKLKMETLKSLGEARRAGDEDLVSEYRQALKEIQHQLNNGNTKMDKE